VDTPLSRDEIEAKLRALAATVPPIRDVDEGDGAVAAMCYVVDDLHLDAEEYVCPACGDRTRYPKGLAFVNVEEIEACRRMVGRIEVLDLMLDESEFCRRCRPGGRDPELVLTVNIPGEEPRVTRRVSMRDLEGLHALTTGRLLLPGPEGTEDHMRYETPRLRQLLGVRPAED